MLCVCGGRTASYAIDSQSLAQSAGPRSIGLREIVNRGPNPTVPNSAENLLGLEAQRGLHPGDARGRSPVLKARSTAEYLVPVYAWHLPRHASPAAAERHCMHRAELQ